MAEIFQSGQLIYLSGVAPTERGDVGAQTRNVLEQVKSVLSGTGSSIERVVSVLVFLRSAADFGTMNDVYRGFWSKEFPTRTTIVAELSTPDTMVEMSLVAVGAAADRVVIHPTGWV